MRKPKNMGPDAEIYLEEIVNSLLIQNMGPDAEIYLVEEEESKDRHIQISAAIDPVQEKQIIVIEVYGPPLDIDYFLTALEGVE